jgi:curved DNA-binding protein
VTRGEDLEADTILSLEEVYHGTSRLIHLNDQTIKVTIKPGVKDGQILRIAGKGGNGIGGGPNGDLFLTIRIAPNHEFHRDGNDLSCSVQIDLYTTVLGGKMQINTMKGKVTVNIPKGTQNGKELRLQGLGMPVYSKKNEYGNLLIKINVILPEQLNEEEINLFKKLASFRK